MKPCISILMMVIFLQLGSSQALFASHDAGGEIFYTCLNACTTRVHFRGFRNCEAVGTIGPFTFTWTGGLPGCTPPPAVGAPSTPVLQEITPVCPGTVTWCTTTNVSIFGVSQYEWYQDFDICAGTPCPYIINWTNCCRSMSIGSLVNPQIESVWIQAGLNTAFLPCNNSPVFLGPPVVDILQGQDHYIANTACDPDGDSLSFGLGPCLSNGGLHVNYGMGFAGPTPMGHSWDVTINSSNGMLFFDAIPGNVAVGVICIHVTEWRHGILIGTSMRDYQINVLPNPTVDTPPTVGNPFNLSTNVTGSSQEIFACNAGPICFDIAAADINAGQNLLLSWSQNLPGATFTEAGNVTVVDTIPGTAAVPPVGRFCWTPPANGHYYVRFTAVDNNCPLLGVGDQVVVIHVGQSPAQASATVVSCPTVQFNAASCGVGPYTYAWSGSGGLSSTAQNPTHTYAGPGSYPWQVIVSDGLASDTLVDTVVIGAGPAYLSFLSGLHYVAPCTGTLYDTLDAGTWPSYQWSTGATTPQIIAYLGGVYGVTVTDSLGCMYHDSTELYWASPDIYGVVKTSTGAPLQNQKMLLIDHDTTLQALWALDSTWTDSLGYYFFCNVVDTLVFLKALPALADYPTQMPTYADTTLFWNHAVTFYPLTQLPLRHDFSTLFGVNPGGPGFIGGLITQGANKLSAVGDPVAGLRVFLRDRQTGAVLGYAISDANGYFSFANIPLGDYEIVPDKPMVSTTNVPALALTVQTPSLDSLDFQLHRYWLELVNGANASPEPLPVGFHAAPNPFQESLNLSLSPEFEGDLEIVVLDVMGKPVEMVFEGKVAAGVHGFTACAGVTSGIYFLRVQLGAETQYLKVVKAGN